MAVVVAASSARADPPIIRRRLPRGRSQRPGRPGRWETHPSGGNVIHNSAAMSVPAKASLARVSPEPRAVPGDGPSVTVAASDDDDREADFVPALRRGEAWARTALVQKYHAKVERLVAGALGIDGDLMDVVQDVFVKVLKNVHQLKDPAALPGWIASLAVFTARGHIRHRRRWRWIRFLAPEDVPDLPIAGHDAEGSATMHAVYRAIDTLPTDERLAFSLRFVSELELTEVAAACQVSLATIKRRLARAEARFLAAAGTSPLLRERLERSHRFGTLPGASEDPS